jgi:hypothetical protein
MVDRVKLKEIVKREAAKGSTKPKGDIIPDGDTRSTQFAKLRKKTGGRQKGTPNKTSAEMKHVLLAAMDMCGNDGEGTDGAIGYLAMIAWENREIFGKLIERLLPFVLTGKDGGPIQHEYTNKADIVQRMKERGLPIPESLMLTYQPRQANETEQ